MVTVELIADVNTGISLLRSSMVTVRVAVATSCSESRAVTVIWMEEDADS